MKVGKPQSKRVSVRLRHKIQKSSANKQRKQRKEAKKNPQWRSRLKRDPGVPNLFPYKAQVLAEIEESKRRKEEEQMAKREQAKARREGKAVADIVGAQAAALANQDDDELPDEMDDDEEEDEVMEEGRSNPMAALLASAQARAQDFGEDEEDDEEDEEDDDDEAGWGGTKDENAAAPNAQPSKKVLPQQALADPVKAVSALMERMQKTQDGIQRLLDHYSAPPLASAGSDVSTRFLVEVARKRGRLGRGGVPNLHSASMLVLNDVNEGRIQLPAVQQTKKADVGGKGEVTIVQTMAAPFRLEGLWGEEKAKTVEADIAQEMVVES